MRNGTICEKDQVDRLCYHHPACMCLLTVRPALTLRAREGHCHALLMLATQPLERCERCERLASGVPIREQILDGKINIDRPMGVGKVGRSNHPWPTGAKRCPSMAALPQ